MGYIFPKQRPRARSVQVLDRAPLPSLVQSYLAAAPKMPGMGQYTYGAIALTVAYQEDNRQYREKLIAVIEDTGRLGVGMWSNKDTLMVRAPAPEFEALAPVFAVIQTSIRLNPVWLAGERRGAANRAARAREMQAYEQKVMREIVDERRRVNAEIAHSMGLFISGREDYINPYTGEVEHGFRHWKHRWQSAAGDVVYTDDPKYDPNWDKSFRRSDFKRSEARPR